MHKSVLLQEVIESANLQKGDSAIDATCGAGGHTKALSEAVGREGRILAIDVDEEALNIARSVVRGENVTFAKGNFAEISDIALSNGFEKVNAIVVDLGVSSMQLDRAERGFSFSKRGVLDMRLDQSGDKNAFDVVNKYSQEELVQIFRKFGEESRAKACAKAIVEARRKRQIKTTDDLAEVVRRVIPRKRGKKIDPATKIFQAIRIEVNNELKNIESALPQMVGLLKKRGRLIIISFHSLEDRIVKEFFKKESRNCICPPEIPVCRCGHQGTIKILTKKPIRPTEKEIRSNPRARSAKMRVAERI